MTKRKAEVQEIDCSVCISLVLCLQTALDSFPEISVVTELKKDGETPAFKVRLSGKAYNKKTMKPHKMPNKVPQVREDNDLVKFTIRYMSSRGHSVTILCFSFIPLFS